MRDMLDEEQQPQKNVFGEPLAVCSNNPRTGFFRDGCCNTGPQDQGSHTVCVVMTDEFLAFSKVAGNDLSTPMPEYAFPGLKGGRPVVFMRCAVAAGFRSGNGAPSCACCDT